MPRRIRSEDIDTLVFKTKNTDLDKGEILHHFVQSLISLDIDVNKETDIAVIDKKCWMPIKKKIMMLWMVFWMI